MRNARSLAVLLILTLPVLLAGGCLMPLTKNVGKIGEYSRQYNVDSIAMAEDGSVIVTCNSYSESDRDACVEETRYIRFKSEDIERWTPNLQRIQEENPAGAWRYRYDGLPFLCFDSFFGGTKLKYAEIMTEQSLPPFFRKNTPLELISVITDPTGEDFREGLEVARTKGYDGEDEKSQRYARAHVWDRHRDRGMYRSEHRVLYQHGDVSCWLLFSKSLTQSPLYRPGSGLVQVLVFVPAVVGDIVMQPVWLYGYAEGIKKASGT